MWRLIGSMLRVPACAAALVLAASSAFADPPPSSPAPTQRVVMRLDFVGAPGCSNPEPFVLALTPRVHGWDPLAPDGPWKLVVTIKRYPRGFQGSAELRDPSGEVTWTRSLSAKGSCFALLDTLALVVAFHIDPPGDPPPAPAPPPTPAPTPPAPASPTSSGEPPPPPAPPTFPTTSAPPSPSTPAPVPIRPSVAAGAWVDFGLAPRPLVGLKVEAGFRRGWFSLAGELRWDPSASAISANGPEGVTQVSTTLLAGGVAACARREWRVWVAGCVVAELGWIQGTIGAWPYGGSQQAGLYAGGGPGARVELPLPAGLSVHAAADLLAARKLAATSSSIVGMVVPTGSVGGVAGGVGLGLGLSF